jgi:Tol biopolymer transport system component
MSIKFRIWRFINFCIIGYGLSESWLWDISGWTLPACSGPLALLMYFEGETAGSAYFIVIVLVIASITAIVYSIINLLHVLFPNLDGRWLIIALAGCLLSASISSLIALSSQSSIILDRGFTYSFFGFVSSATLEYVFWRYDATGQITLREDSRAAIVKIQQYLKTVLSFIKRSVLTIYSDSRYILGLIIVVLVVIIMMISLPVKIALHKAIHPNVYFQRLIFVSDADGDKELYGINSDGSGEMQITNNDYSDYSPVWSPDRNMIAFVSKRDGDSEIYLLGHQQFTQLTNNSADDIMPQWSPDGTKIAFVSSRSGNDEIYVMGSDGTGQTKITDNETDATEPAWSPDGTKIAYASGGNICITDLLTLKTECQSSLREGVFDIFLEGAAANLSWSPSGKQIMYVDRDSDWFWFYDRRVFVMNPDFTGLRVLTREYDNTNAFNPAWSPDGNMIAFLLDQSGSYEIYVMASNGANKLRLTENNLDDNNPVWSPDGEKIAYISHNSKKNRSEIHIINRDGTGDVILTEHQGYINGLMWEP